MKDDVVESLNLQLEQMQLTRHMYSEAQAVTDSMSNIRQLVVSLPDISETVHKTYGLVQSLHQTKLGVWNKIQAETYPMLTIRLQMKTVRKYLDGCQGLRIMRSRPILCAGGMETQGRGF